MKHNPPGLMSLGQIRRQRIMTRRAQVNPAEDWLANMKGTLRCLV